MPVILYGYHLAKHWHGAAHKFNDTRAIQEGLNGSVAEWLEKVSDEQYALKSGLILQLKNLQYNKIASYGMYEAKMIQYDSRLPLSSGYNPNFINFGNRPIFIRKVNPSHCNSLINKTAEASALTFLQNLYQNHYHADRLNCQQSKKVHLLVKQKFGSSAQCWFK